MKRVSGLFILVATLVLAIGCTKKRDDKWASQGPKYHAAISEFDGKIFDVQTGNAIAESKNNASGADIKIDIKSKSTGAGTEVTEADLNSVHSIVEFNTDAELALKDRVIFRGHPNKPSTYQIMYRVLDRRLLVLKVAHRKDMPWYEIPLALEELEDGRLAYPILEYPITLLKLEKATNSDNDETNLILELPVQSKGEAMVFKFDKDRFSRPKELQLNEIFPVSFFGFAADESKSTDDAEVWYHIKTIVDANGTWENLSGFSSNYDAEGQSASKVIFTRSQAGNKVQVRNASKLAEQEGRENRGTLDNASFLTIGAEFFDLRLAKDGNEATVNPEKNVDKEVDQRGFVQLDLTDLGGKHQGARTLTHEISGIHIEDGFFSFTVESFGEVVTGWNWWSRQPITREFRGKVRYVFYKKSERDKKLAQKGCDPYVARTAFAEDFQKFGMFSTMKNIWGSSDLRSKAEFEKLYKMMRHNPSCEIVYNPSEKTPKKYLPHLALMVNRWKEATNALGFSNFNIRFEPTPVRVGDIRYNIVDIIEPVNEYSYAGRAGWIGDPDTGEIIYGYAQIQASQLKSWFQRYVVSYLMEELEVSDVGYSESWVHKSEFNDQQLTQISVMKDHYHLQDNEHFFEYIFNGAAPADTDTWISYAKNNVPLRDRKDPGFVRMDREYINKEMGNPYQQQDPMMDIQMGSGHAHHECALHKGFIRARGSLHQQIKKFCSVGSKDGSVISLEDYIKQNEGVDTSQEEGPFQIDQKVLNTCLQNLLVGAEIDGEFQVSEVMIGIGLHEVGHSLGLRHNFAGSADAKNFYAAGDNVPMLAKTVGSSSVMDYTNMRDLFIAFPGKYDVAALRYMYGEQVIVNGSPKQVDTTRPLRNQGLANSMDQYKFCSDQQGRSYARWDCNVFDYGTTPEAITQAHIEDFRESLKFSRLKYDGLSYYRSQASRSIFPMLRIYEQWRHELSQAIGKSGQHLHHFGSDADYYEIYLKKLAHERPSTFGKTYKMFYPAVQQMHDFLLNEVALMNNRYCVLYNDQTRDVKAVELQKIRHAAPDGTRIVTCYSDFVKTYISERAEEFPGMVVKEDIGYELWNDFYERSEFKSSGGAWGVAKLLPDVRGSISERFTAFLALTQRFGLHPIGRTLNGFAPSMLDEPNLRMKTQNALMNRIRSGVKLKTFKGDYYFANFAEEQRLSEMMYFMFRTGLSATGTRIDSDMARAMPFTVFMSSNDPSVVSLAQIKIGSLYVYAADHSQYEAISMLNAANLMDQILSHSGPDRIDYFTEDEKESLEALILNAPGMANASLEDITVGDFRSFAQSLEDLSGSYAIKQVAQIAFKNELGLAEILNSAQNLANIPDEAEFTQVFAEKILVKRGEAYTKEHMKSRLDRAVSTYNITVDNYKQSSEEVDVQRNLIKNMLVRTSFYVGNVGGQ